MTCIVALVEKGVMWMGGDSAVQVATDVWTEKMPKVWRKEGPDRSRWLFGVAGNGRISNVLQYAFLPPLLTSHPSLEEGLILEMVPELRKALRRFSSLEEKDTDRMKGGILLTLEGRIFRISGEFDVSALSIPYYAIGTGDDVAKGALYSNQGRAPRERILDALRASAEFKLGVRAPFTIISSEGHEETVS